MNETKPKKKETKAKACYFRIKYWSLTAEVSWYDTLNKLGLLILGNIGKKIYVDKFHSSSGLWYFICRSFDHKEPFSHTSFIIHQNHE